MTGSRFKNNFELLLLLLLPVGFVVGPLIAEIIVNTLIIIFLFDTIKNKKLFIFKNRVFIFFLIFYIYLIINLLLSNFIKESFLNIFSYIRFFIFPFAIYSIFEKNIKYIKFAFIFLSITILVVILDGYFQFIFDKNFLGYEKYRPDRISGFFKDDLILGSFLARLMPLFIGLILFFKNDFKLTLLNLIIFLLTFILIFLSGERSAFLTSTLAFLIIILQIKSFFYIRTILSLVSVLLVSILMINNPTIFDRYITQTKNQIFGSSNSNQQVSNLMHNDKNIFLPNYMPMFKTSLNMFKDNKLLGKGPKSYRHLCNDVRFVSYFSDIQYKDNRVLQIKKSWKKPGYLHVEKIYVTEGDIIEIGDKIFSYKFDNDKKIYFYISDKEGKIKKLYKQKKYQLNDIVMDIVPQYSPNLETYYNNACNTHPHNFYIQILAEIGLIGFTFIFGLFLYLLYLLSKNLFFKYFKNKTLFSDSELCILVGFFVVLWPITTNGNFFNNWINLISFYPLGFFIYIYNRKSKK